MQQVACLFVIFYLLVCLFVCFTGSPVIAGLTTDMLATVWHGTSSSLRLAGCHANSQTDRGASLT